MMKTKRRKKTKSKKEKDGNSNDIMKDLQTEKKGNRIELLPTQDIFILEDIELSLRPSYAVVNLLSKDVLEKNTNSKFSFCLFENLLKRVDERRNKVVSTLALFLIRMYDFG